MTRRCVHCGYPAEHLDRAGWCDDCAEDFDGEQETRLTIADVMALTGFTKKQITNRITCGSLVAHKNAAGEFIYVERASLDAYLAKVHFTLPDGYISIAEAAKRFGVREKSMRDRLRERRFEGIKDNMGRWAGVLVSSLTKYDDRRRCTSCEILLEDREPGPLCDWCARGGIKLASLPYRAYAPAVHYGRLGIGV